MQTSLGLNIFPNSGGKHSGVKWRDLSEVAMARLMIGRGVVTASPRSAGQTGAERTNVFLLRCAELLNRQQEERPANSSLPDQLWINQSLGGVYVCVCMCVCMESLTHQLAKKLRPEPHHLGTCASRIF